ncbi:MAG: DUF3426 domain-containing protein [Burkholderiaceae bacterium]
MPAPAMTSARGGADPATPSSIYEDRQVASQVGPGRLAAETGLADDEEEAIDFFGRTSNPVFDFDLPPRGVWIAAGLLALVLMLQVVIGARDVLAARIPAAQGLIRLLSAPLGLTVSLPINAEAISIESFDLARPRSGAGQRMTRYSMNMLLRNRAGHVLRWPSIELTLTDSTGGILVRKVLMPADYLRDEARVKAGMAGESEEAIRLDLAADKIVPSGYSAILFYH